MWPPRFESRSVIRTRYRLVTVGRQRAARIAISVGVRYVQGFVPGKAATHQSRGSFFLTTKLQKSTVNHISVKYAVGSKFSGRRLEQIAQSRCRRAHHVVSLAAGGCEFIRNGRCVCSIFGCGCAGAITPGQPPCCLGLVAAELFFMRIL